MTWDVTPAERLRSVTRRGVADHVLAAEAAGALAGFASEPASLVVACRRVLAHHRAHGALWWVCARILAAPEPNVAAREAMASLDADRTANRLAATLPLLDDGDLVATIGWPHAVDEALAERQDIAVLSVRVEGVDAFGDLRYRQTDRNVPVVDVWDIEALALLLVPAFAIGPDRTLVPAGTDALLRDLGGRARDVWLVGGVGRVLPARLFDAARTAAEHVDEMLDPEEAAPDVVSLERIDRIAGPRGVELPTDAAARIDCPIVPELLRPLD
ncbi:MAG TPA: hypothetical protein VFX21_10695 [Acidimicrobiia bacterium]|nr:hypothetical protein [Acidimicrobiia bacterium]